VPESVLSKEELLREFAAAYERVIAAARLADQRGGRSSADWGPREVIAHLAGWEVMANVRIPHILAGMPPAEFSDPWQERVMNDAINTTFVTLAGDRSLESLSGVLRQAYRRTAELLRAVDEAEFQPGTYVYERTSGIIEHCQEHTEAHLSSGA
jgi:hypothetical protein